MQQSSNEKSSDKKPGLTWSTPNATAPMVAVNNAKQSPAQLALPKASPTNGSTARYVGLFVGGLVLGVAVAWGWSALRNSGERVAVKNTAAEVKTTKDQMGDARASVAAGVVLENSDIDVASPQSAGQSVSINRVTVSQPTWVVVYDNNAGKPGNVLGAQLFFTSTGGAVTLLRPTMAGKTYFIGRAIDDGDRKFQKVSDSIVADANGNPVLVTFTTN